MPLRDGIESRSRCSTFEFKSSSFRRTSEAGRRRRRLHPRRLTRRRENPRPHWRLTRPLVLYRHQLCFGLTRDVRSSKRARCRRRSREERIRIRSRSRFPPPSFTLPSTNHLHPDLPKSLAPYHPNPPQLPSNSPYLNFKPPNLRPPSRRNPT